MADYNKAIEVDPKYALTYKFRVDALYKNGDLDCAVSDYDKAIQLDPSDAEVYFKRGLAHALKGEYDLAIQDYTDAIKCGPKMQISTMPALPLMRIWAMRRGRSKTGVTPGSLIQIRYP